MRSILLLALFAAIPVWADDDEIIIIEEDESENRAKSTNVEQAEDKKSADDPDEGGLKVPEDTTDVITLRWLDPPGEYWKPRRGERGEITILVGGEAELGAPTLEETVPSVGGMTLSMIGYYYAVDRIAVAIGLRNYLGFERPATGTSAQAVVTPVAGVRFELVGENRFSLMLDILSGPAVFIFSDTFGGPQTAWAVGSEAMTGLAVRYSLGPFTMELRPFFGGRFGSSQEIQSPNLDVGPFSALYAGVDFGVTYSLASEDLNKADEEEND